jgi:hypothetical protein
LTRHLEEPARHKLAAEVYPLMLKGQPAKALLLAQGIIRLEVR